MSKTTQDAVKWKLSLGQARSGARLPTTQPSRDGKALLFPIWAAFVGGPGPATCILEPQFSCCPMSLNPKVLKISSSSNILISLIQPNPSPGFNFPKSQVTEKAQRRDKRPQERFGAIWGRQWSNLRRDFSLPTPPPWLW